MNIGPIKLNPIRNPQLVRVILELRRLIVDAFGLQLGTVANLAAFAAMTATQMGYLDTGSHKWVRTLLRYYRLDKASVLAVDGITVIAAVGGGRWIAEPRVDRIWDDQPVWFINAATGNDENDGASGPTAIKTWAEYVRRTGEDRFIAAKNVITTLQGAFPVTDPVHQNIRIGRGGLNRIQAALTVLAGPFTVLAYARNPATDNPGTLSANEVGFDPALFIGKMIRFTTGPAAGCYAFIKKDNGAGVAQVSTPTTAPQSDDLQPAVLVPLNGNAFEVVDLVTCYGDYLRVECEGDDTLAGGDAPKLVVDSLHFLNGDVSYPNAFSVGGQRLQMRKCIADNLLVVGDANLVQCKVGSISSSLEVRSGVAVMWAGLYGLVNVDSDATVFMRGGPLLEASVQLSGKLNIDAEGLGIYDAPIIEISMSVGSSLVTAGIVHGTAGGGANGVSMNAGAIFKYDPALPPRIHTGANAVKIGGISRSWADVPYIDPHQGTMVIDGVAAGGSPDTKQTGLIGACTQNVTRYLAPNMTEQVADLSGWIVQNNTTVRKLRVHAGTASGIGQTYTVTILKNGVASALTAQLAGAAVNTDNLADSFLANPGDRISVKADSSVTSLAADLLVSFEMA